MKKTHIHMEGKIELDANAIVEKGTQIKKKIIYILLYRIIFEPRLKK